MLGIDEALDLVAPGSCLLIEEGIETAEDRKKATLQWQHWQAQQEVQWQKGGKAAKGGKRGKGKSKGGQGPKLLQDVEGELASLKEELAAMRQSMPLAGSAAGSAASSAAGNASGSCEGFAAAGDTELQGALNSARG